MMKREREGENINITSMAKYLMLLSHGSEFDHEKNYSSNLNNRVFECKTCKRQFSSFQALGGHRASHKKPRLMEITSSDDQVLHHDSIVATTTTKVKTHECSICGLEFAIGQALGGHMRRHRRKEQRANNSNENMHTFMTNTSNSSSSGCSTIDNTNSENMKKGNTKRFLFLDLNLTPLENDLKFLKIGQSTLNLVDCFN
ncbi:zinc finger protein ZAT7-like [Cicer arietinum]|uniref:Zinc finger protein ZAT11-like n=1 Tax=Cicer arietinum TaxID=3827 RepID=A0A1S2Y1K1_CICAR|nr:zinc finger protein ZAT11-like [Cicer arietinum]